MEYIAMLYSKNKMLSFGFQRVVKAASIADKNHNPRYRVMIF
jgi:hypothetical protein